MFKRKRGKKVEVKRDSQEKFSTRSEIDYWEQVYARNDFRGACYRARMNQALSWLDSSNASTRSFVLDAGCGSGIITCDVAKRGFTTYGMDYSLGMIERAKRKCIIENDLDISFLLGDIESLPFKASYFDAVLCIGVVSYLQSEKMVLTELARILKPGGTLVLSFVNKARLVVRLDPLYLLRHRTLRPLVNIFAFRTKKTETKKDSHRAYFIPNIDNSLNRVGFRPLEYKTIPNGLLTFFGREIPPLGLNIKIAVFFEKFSTIPIIKSLGNMCIVKAKKVT